MTAEEEEENSMKNFDLALNPLHAKDDRADKNHIKRQQEEIQRQGEQNKLLLERLKTQKRQGVNAGNTRYQQQPKSRKGKAKKQFAQSYAHHDDL